MYLFFDTETTGTPKDYKASPRDLDNWPRIIQFAWAAFDINGKLIKTNCDLICPDGWEIPKEKFWIDNGFSTEKSKEKGIPIDWALENFILILNKSEYLIAHNMDFDLPITQAEMIRAKVRASKSPLKFCTMKSGTDICQIPGSYGKFKWPKLEELHQHLFNKGFDGAHDALNDVLACAKCFFEMKNRKLILKPELDKL